MRASEVDRLCLQIWEGQHGHTEQAVGLRLAICGQGIVRGLVEIDRKTRIDIIEIHLGIVRDDQNIDSLLIHLGQAYMRIRRAPEKIFDRRALADQFFVNAGGDGQDRKRDVEGKGVSVRVDIGGQRMNTKKKKKIQIKK